MVHRNNNFIFISDSYQQFSFWDLGWWYTGGFSNLNFISCKHVGWHFVSCCSRNIFIVLFFRFRATIHLHTAPFIQLSRMIQKRPTQSRKWWSPLIGKRTFHTAYPQVGVKLLTQLTGNGSANISSLLRVSWWPTWKIGGIHHIHRLRRETFPHWVLIFTSESFFGCHVKCGCLTSNVHAAFAIHWLPRDFIIEYDP